MKIVSEIVLSIPLYSIIFLRRKASPIMHIYSTIFFFFFEHSAFNTL